LERIDDLCAEFERKWQSDQSPSIESALTEDISPDERDVLLAELIVLDVDYRRRRSESPNEQDYLDRFPDNVSVIRDAFRGNDQPKRAFLPPSVEQLSEQFPSLQITELLGAGGMGAVYKARQEGLDRVVALKILPEEFGHDVKFALRFTREARTLAKLNHPNIVSVYEFGHVDDTYYFWTGRRCGMWSRPVSSLPLMHWRSCRIFATHFSTLMTTALSTETSNRKTF